MNRNRLIAFVLLAACAPEPAQPPPVCPACPPDKPIRVAVLGDRTGDSDEAAFLAALKAAKRLSPDAVLSVGDLIEGYQPDGRIAEAEAEWDRLFATTRRLLGGLPIYAAAGNHDVWSARSQALFERRMGRPVNHAFDLGGARVILFDTSRYARESEIPDAALDWLWRALRDARDRAVRIVVTHAPLWAIDPGGRYGSPLHDVLIAGRADWVLTGHWHHAMSDDRDGIRYRMIGPSGSAPNRQGHPESGNLRMVGLLVLDGKGAELSLIPAGSVLPSDAYPYRLNQIEWAIENQAVRASGFEMSPLAPRRSGRLLLRATNVAKQPLEGALSFAPGEDGWRVLPPSRKIALAPGRKTELAFGFWRAPGTPLFPGPRLTLPFPWEEGGSYLLNTRIAPTLSVRIPETRAAPRIDGRLDDPDWRGAADLGPLRPAKGPPIGGKTILRAMAKGGVLFLGVAVEGPGAVEELIVLLDVDPEDRAYARIRVDSAGAAEGRLVGSEAPWSEPIGAAVSREPGRWSAELALNLGALGKSPGARRIGFNLGLSRTRDESSSVAVWQPLSEHDNDSFGALVLGQGSPGRPYSDASRQVMRP